MSRAGHLQQARLLQELTAQDFEIAKLRSKQWLFWDGFWRRSAVLVSTELHTWVEVALRWIDNRVKSTIDLTWEDQTSTLRRSTSRFTHSPFQTRQHSQGRL